MSNINKQSPWKWIPSLYFAQGLPYVAVMTMAVVMYKNLGLSNTDIAFYTGWLYLPWVIKPLWSPFVDLIKTKRFWIIAMQFFVAVGFAGVAFFIPAQFYVKLTLAFFWLLAFSSATHDIAADGFYMLGLTSGDQSFFVGIRNTCYRLATIFGQGVLVMLAGLLYEGKLFPSIKGNMPLAWSLTFFILAGIFIGFSLYHLFVLPKPTSDISRKLVAPKQILRDFGHTFVTFFQKKDVLLMFFFILTYRLGEAQLSKIAPPFLLDSLANGGLNMPTSTYGLIYGTFGVAALLLGGILGGLLISRDGFKRWIFPMALMINLPDLLYVFLAYYQPDIWMAAMFVILEQFGYGFGFTAYMLYLINIADGKYKTAHYAIATGFMALGMMLPSMISGWIQEQIGYTLFFIWVCICTIPGIIAAIFVRSKIDPHYGQK